MEKKIWTAPKAEVEQFMANEYVAACYKINCNVGDFNTLWNESNNVEGLQTEGKNGVPADEQLLSYASRYGCQKWHNGVIRDSDPELNGYIVSYSLTGRKTVTPVFWWKEKLGSSSDYHATYLGSQTYETNPNAS